MNDMHTASLQGELSALKSKLDLYRTLTASQTARISRMCAEIQGLKADARRLDYLDTVDVGIDHVGYGDYRHYSSPAEHQAKFMQRRTTVREVIDAAIAKGQS